MKWFKHDTDAHMSEGVDALISILGFAGYGRWNRLLEIVASKMDESDRCHAEYSTQKWCSFLRLKQKKLISFLELTQNELKTKVVCSENKIRIEIPNLLKKRDNYTNDLQANSKRLVSKEVDKKKIKKKIKKDTKTDRFILPDSIPEKEWNGFVEMRVKIKKPMTDYAKELKVSKLLKMKEAGEDIKEILNRSTSNNWTDLYSRDEKKKTLAEKAAML